MPKITPPDWVDETTSGVRYPRDRKHCCDHDLIIEKDATTRRYLRRDGTPHPKGDRPE